MKISNIFIIPESPLMPLFVSTNVHRKITDFHHKLALSLLKFMSMESFSAYLFASDFFLFILFEILPGFMCVTFIF